VRLVYLEENLTTTSYKYLDIGISVGAVLYVELILGNNQIVLPISTWNLLMQKRADIERYLQSTPLTIGDLTIEVHIMHQSKIVKFTLCDNSLYIKPLLHLFNYDNCIDHMHNWLCYVQARGKMGRRKDVTLVSREQVP